jgi:signal transduction histidine kinase/CheY-like chemotaxis protein
MVELPGQPFLKAVKLSKRYGGVEALSDVDLDIYPGEIVGVVGDTDSGKSTLLNLISGVLRPDSGRFYVRGRRVQLSPSFRAAQHGIKVVHQDINVAEHMGALTYIFAGQVPTTNRLWQRWLGWWNTDRLEEYAEKEFSRLGFDIPPLKCPLNDLTSVQRKMVAFVHATIWSPHLLLLDEPINTLEAYRANILHLIRETRRCRRSVLLVTQNLDDIFQIADRILILNAGRKIAERHTADTTVEEVVSLILGSVEEKLTPAVWALSNYFNVRRQADELDRLNKALERRAIQLQAHAEVAQSVTSILDRDELLTQIAQIIQQRFGYYHTGIFLADSEAGCAILRSSASRHEHAELTETRFALDEQSLVGWCALHGESRLSNHVLRDPLFKPERALPDTQSELVLPLRIGRRVLGVLDLQSDHVDAFGEDDVTVMQSLADQLAIAIRNADLFDTAEAAREQADKANRLKSVFLSNMSHELRTPLSAIIGLTQAMLDSNLKIYHTPLPEEYQRDLHTISQSGGHLLALINDILDLSKIEAGHIKLNLSAVDLKGVLNEALFTTQALLHGRPVELRSDFPADLPPIWADSVCIRQVMLNLLSNAAKFTEQGSIQVNIKTTDRMVQVCISDTGIGIPDHVRQNIFDRFHQGDVLTSRKYGGTGLGLSISRQLVELLGGAIWVDSEVGSGSQFYFTIPIATSEQQIQSAALPPETPLYGSQRSVIFDAQHEEPDKEKPKLVLVAQNDLQAASALHQTFEREGYVTELTAADKLSIELAEAILPDLIVLDTTTTTGTRVLKLLLEVSDLTHIPIMAIVSPEQPDRPVGQTRPIPVMYLEKSEATPQNILQQARVLMNADHR